MADRANAAVFLQGLTGMQPLIIIMFIAVRGAALDLADMRSLTGKSADSLQPALDSLCVKGWIVKQTGQHGKPSYLPGRSSFFDLLGVDGLFSLAEPVRTSLTEPVRALPSQIPQIPESGFQTPGKPESETGSIKNLMINDNDDVLKIKDSSSLLIEPFQIPEKPESGFVNPARFVEHVIEQVEYHFLDQPAPAFPTLKMVLENLELIFDDALFVTDVPPDTSAELALAWVCKAFHDARRGRLSNPVGLVRARLKNKTPRKINRLEELPDAYREALGLWRGTCARCDLAFISRADLQEHEKQPHDQQADDEDVEITQDTESLEVEDSIHPAARRAWQSVIGQLQQEMPRASFDTWVRDAKVAAYEAGVMAIRVRNSYARDWLESRLLNTVSGLLAHTLGCDVEVRFVVGCNHD